MNSANRRKLVSVGVPTYNRGSTYLRETLESIRNQTYKNLEIVISDNASTDITQKVCEEFAKKDSRIRYIRQKTNIGPTANFNVLRREARGDYFVQVCDDDLLAPTFIEKCAARLTVHPEAAVAMTNFVEFDDKRRQINFDPERYVPSKKDLYGRLRQYILMYEADGKDRLMWGLWRRDVAIAYAFDERPFPDPPGWDFEDMSFVFQGLTRGTCELVNEVLFYKRAESAAFDTPQRKGLIKRLFDTLVYSRLRRLFKPFFYKRMRQIIKIKTLSVFIRTKLLLWTLFVMSRLFWKRKI